MNITVLGTGLMGLAISERLMVQGHSLTVYNRTPAKAEPLIQKGAVFCADPAEAIRRNVCILCVLTDGPSTRAVLSSVGQKDWVGRTLIQMGTISVEESCSLDAEIRAAGGAYVECPVLGSRKEAESGQLILLAGASQELFSQWNSLMADLGEHVNHLGDVGSAAAVKLALNHLIAVHATGISLSLGLVERHNVPVTKFMDILRSSALYAPMFDKKLSNWQNRSYANPNFPAKHLLKDVRLILEQAEADGLATEGLAGVEQLLAKTVEQGLGDLDYSAVFNTINRIDE